MSWDKLTTENQSTEAIQKQKEEAQRIARLTHRTFSTDDGQELLAHLTNHFVIHNDTPLNATNIEYESGYHAGEAGVVRWIIHQMQRAEEL
jgi:hypothetical protein